MKTRIFAGALLFDQATKYAAVHFLRNFRPEGSGSLFSFGLYRNYGISFSLFASVPSLGLWMNLFGCFFLVMACFRFKRLRMDIPLLEGHVSPN